MQLITTRQPNGLLETVIHNDQGRAVARVRNHNLTAEELLIAVRDYRANHPELFGQEREVVVDGRSLAYVRT